MKNCSLGIIGAGFVGGAIARGFSLHSNIRVYDKDPNKSSHTLTETLESDFVFVCVPTPMVSVEGGQADLSILESVIKEIGAHNYTGIVILKSTIPMGTTVRLRKESGLKIIHNPEFLTARNADIDFITPARTILGGISDWVELVKDLFKSRFPGTNVITMTSDESEAVKYIANCFFAVKILYFNEIFFGLKKFNVNWEKVMEGVMTDGRIGVSHHQVPGHDGKYSFGGTCLPKDLCSLISQFEDSGFDPKMLKACWEQNKKFRPEMDWGQMSSAVSKVCS